MFRLLTSAMLVVALFATVGCDEADFGTEPDGIGVDATDGVGVDDGTMVDPVAPIEPMPDADRPALDTEDDDAVLLDSDEAAPADVESTPDAASDAAAPGATVEEVPADALPAEEEQPEEEQPEEEN